GGQWRWPSRNIPQLLLRLWPLAFRPWTEAVTFLSADTAPPRPNAPQCCTPPPGSRLTRSALPLVALLLHRPRLTWQKYTAVPALPPSPASRTVLGASG